MVERGTTKFPVLYPGSLLYIISGLLESEDDKIHDIADCRHGSDMGGPRPFTELEVVQQSRLLVVALTDSVVRRASGSGTQLRLVEARDFFRTPETVESFSTFAGSGWSTGGCRPCTTQWSSGIDQYPRIDNDRLDLQCPTPGCRDHERLADIWPRSNHTRAG